MASSFGNGALSNENEKMPTLHPQRPKLRQVMRLPTVLVFIVRLLARVKSLTRTEMQLHDLVQR